MNSIQQKWDIIYQQSNTLPEPCSVLTENNYLLPKQGTALDLACGLGANALYLAGKGLTVQAWDVSSVALKFIDHQARQAGMAISLIQRDIGATELPQNAFDIIVVSRFLDRALSHAIIAALKDQGLLFYQTYTRDKLTKHGPKNPDFLLARNELLRLFSDLTIVYYRENDNVGNLQLGERNEAQFIGQKIIFHHD